MLFQALEPADLVKGWMGGVPVKEVPLAKVDGSDLAFTADLAFPFPAPFEEEEAIEEPLPLL